MLHFFLLKKLDNSDSSNDLALLSAWCEYYSNGFCSSDEENFFLTNFVPKVVRILLKRRFSEGNKSYRANILSTSKLLLHLTSIIASKFSVYSECFASLCAELLDPTNSFYSRYSSPKYDPPHIFGHLTPVPVHSENANSSSSSASSSWEANAWVEELIAGQSVVEVLAEGI
jgi:hypothetical protein